MRKCPDCQSCYVTRWLYMKMYKICTLCRKAYTVEEGKLIEVTDPDTISKLFALLGNRL